MGRAAAPLFCLFVLALGVVVAGVSAHGPGAAVSAVPPGRPTLIGPLAVAGIAAALSNVVNNPPATVVMLSALGAGASPGLVLAMLIGVDIGPNLTYVGSLATMLWRRVLAGAEAAPTLAEFLRLAALAAPACLVGAVVTLWLGVVLVPG